jgi:hypothetical protein
LDQIKTILGITDASKDAAINAAAPIVTRYFENYCRRGLAYDEEVVEWVDMGPRLPLFRYPIKEILEYEINEAPQALPPKIEPDRGFIVAGQHCARHRAKVTYSGGYPQDDVPLDLADAYARCVGDSIGVAIEGGGTGGSAPLKSLSLGSGALAVAFETGAAVANTFDTSDAPPLLQPYVFTLRQYQQNGYV